MYGVSGCTLQCDRGNRRTALVMPPLIGSGSQWQVRVETSHNEMTLIAVAASSQMHATMPGNYSVCQVILTLCSLYEIEFNCF